MDAAKFGLAAAQPTGWSLSIARREAAASGERTHPVLHACTRAMPRDRGDFGSGVVDLLAPDDIFVALIEYGAEVADVGLFARQGMPRLAPSQFDPNRLQRPVPGRSAAQHFFSDGGRAFCLFTVIGSHARRMVTVPQAAQLVRGFRVTDRATMLRRGGMP